MREIDKSIFFSIPFNRIYELCANPNIIDFGWLTFFQWIDNNNKSLNSFEFAPGSTVNLFILFFLCLIIVVKFHEIYCTIKSVHSFDNSICNICNIFHMQFSIFHCTITLMRFVMLLLGTLHSRIHSWFEFMWWNDTDDIDWMDFIFFGKK